MQPDQEFTLEQLLAEKERRKKLKSPSQNGDYSLEELMAEKERRKSLDKSEVPESEQEEGMLDYAKRAFARGTRNAAVGAVDTADFLATPVRSAYNAIAPLIGAKQAPAIGQEVAKGIDTLTGGYTAPKNDEERVGESIGRGLGGIFGGFGLGTASQGLKNAPGLIKTAGKFLQSSNSLTPTNLATTGSVSGAIQHSLNKEPEDILGAVGSGIIPGIAIPAATGALSLLSKKGRQGAAAKTGELLKINPKAVETFEKAGVTPTLADVSESKIPKMLTSKLEHTPLAAEPIREAKELQRSQILEALEQGNVAKPLTIEQAGKLSAKGARNVENKSNAKFSKQQKKFDQDIETLSKAGKDMVGTESVVNFFDDEIFSKFKDPLQQQLFEESSLGKEYKRFYEAAEKNGGKLPYNALKDFLDHIRDKITTFGEIGSKTQGRFKQFSKNIVNDIERDIGTNLKELGNDSYNNWKNYKKNYSIYKEEVVPKLNEIYKKDKKGGTDAFIDLITSQRKAGEKPGIVLKGLDRSEQLDLTNAVHKHLGTKKDGTFDPIKWSREIKGLSPESRKILLSPLEEHSREKLMHIAESVDLIKSTLAEANKSGSGYYIALGSLIGGAGKATLSLLGGNPVPAASLATGLFLGNKVSDKVLTNPKFINWMYKGMKAKDFNHFERNLDRVPKVGKETKSINRAVKNWKDDVNTVELKKTLHVTPQKGKETKAEYK